MKTLTLSILLISCLSAISYAQPSITGNWISLSPEKTATGSFGIRQFHIEKKTWEVQYTLYADSTLNHPVFLFRANGEYTLEGPSKAGAGIFDAIFRFSKKYLTLKTTDTLLAKRFGLSSCHLIYNTEKDITQTGCAYLASKAACAQEYDLVSIKDEQLFLGARPASGGMCEPSRRPASLYFPLKKQSGASNSRATSFPFKNIVDLTHTLNNQFPFIPTPVTYPFELKPIAAIDGFGVAANEWKIHEHIGTQFDAPNHFIKNGMAADEIDIRNLLVPAIVIDISNKAARDRDAVLTVADIINWEKRYGAIPENAAVLMNCGWDKKIHSTDFIGMDSLHKKHFPGISKEAAEFLVTQRNIAGVGVDVISFDPGIDDTYQTHRVILGKGKWALECLANLGSIPPKGAFLFVGAPKVEGATGGLARVIAVW